MAKTALLAQNDNLAIESLKQSVGRSLIDLSHSTTFPIDVDGAILPFCCVETVPSDAFEISVECLLRQLSPLKVPIMTNFRLNTAFYYCDNRLGWKKWERFMSGGRSGNEVYNIPRVGNMYSQSGDSFKFSLFDKNPTFNINLYNSLHSYFGVKLNREVVSNPSFDDFPNDNDELPIAFPFFDYQIICRDYYTDVDRLKQNPDWSTFFDFNDLNSDWAYSNLFPVDDDEFRLIDGIQAKCGYNTDDDIVHSSEVKGCVLDKVRYHNVREDYFTSSKKAPMRGDAPLLTANETVVLPSGTELKVTDKTARTISAGLSAPYVSQTQIHLGTSMKYNQGVDSSQRIISANSSDIPSGDPNIAFDHWSDPSDVGIYASLQQDHDLIIRDDLTLSQPVTTSITAAEIRLLSQLTVWQELNMLHEPYYNDFLNAHFEGVRVGDSPTEKPIYIGGTSQLVSINEILQTSASTDTSSLGTQGATAMSLANNYVGKYYCNNYGYIIGVAYIIPDMYYEPAIPRGFSRRTKEDFYSPEFANLSMQATLNKEIFYSTDPTWNNQPWGYTGAFDELRSIPNRIAGDLLNDSYTDLKAWVLRREFDNLNKPAMSTSFLSLKGNVDKTAFQVPSMPAFMLQCANYIKAIRPMPKVAIPKAL